MDSHPITTNAIVAIISYAEYDMEDAVVINKAALERGMFAGVCLLRPKPQVSLFGRGRRTGPHLRVCFRFFSRRVSGNA